MRNPYSNMCSKENIFFGQPEQQEISWQTSEAFTKKTKPKALPCSDVGSPYFINCTKGNIVIEI